MVRARQPRHFSDEEYDQAITNLIDDCLPDGRPYPFGRSRYGRHSVVEDVADEMIRRSLLGVTRYCDKDDILTPWKENMRARREILNSTGVADPAVRRGMYHRASNPMKKELNSRLGIAQARSSGSITLSAVHAYDGSNTGEDE
jgi:hypothetical protein